MVNRNEVPEMPTWLPGAALLVGLVVIVVIGAGLYGVVKLFGLW